MTWEYTFFKKRTHSFYPQDIHKRARATLLNSTTAKEIQQMVLSDLDSTVLNPGGNGYGCEFDLEQGMKGGDVEGFVRLSFSFKVTTRTFDLFFNGVNGYRGQFFTGTFEGEKFNSEIIKVIKGSLKHFLTTEVESEKREMTLNTASKQKVTVRAGQLFDKLIDDSTTKIWIGSDAQQKKWQYGDIANNVWEQKNAVKAFLQATPSDLKDDPVYELLKGKVGYWHQMGPKFYLPEDPSILDLDVKSGWYNPNTGKIGEVVGIKKFRSLSLHMLGFT